MTSRSSARARGCHRRPLRRPRRSSRRTRVRRRGTGRRASRCRRAGRRRQPRSSQSTGRPRWKAMTRRPPRPLPRRPKRSSEATPCPGCGTATLCHADPVQCSIRFSPAAAPTAHTLPAETAATPRSSAWAPTFGLATTTKPLDTDVDPTAAGTAPTKQVPAATAATASFRMTRIPISSRQTAEPDRRSSHRGSGPSTRCQPSLLGEYPGQLAGGQLAGQLIALPGPEVYQRPVAGLPRRLAQRLRHVVNLGIRSHGLGVVLHHELVENPARRPARERTRQPGRSVSSPDRLAMRHHRAGLGTEQKPRAELGGPRAGGQDGGDSQARHDPSRRNQRHLRILRAAGAATSANRPAPQRRPRSCRDGRPPRRPAPPARLP